MKTLTVSANNQNSPQPSRRGRKKSQATLDRETTAAALKEIFDQARALQPSREERNDMKKLAAGLDKAHQQLLRDWQSPPFPRHLIYRNLELDEYDPKDQSLTIEQHERARRIQEETVRAEKSILGGQKLGSRTVANAARLRRKAVFPKNRVLIGKLGTPGYSNRRVAEILHREWEVVEPQQLLPGEPSTLKARGDGKPAPSFETLRTTWLPSVTTKDLEKG